MVDIITNISILFILLVFECTLAAITFKKMNVASSVKEYNICRAIVIILTLLIASTLFFYLLCFGLYNIVALVLVLFYMQIGSGF